MTRIIPTCRTRRIRSSTTRTQPGIQKVGMMAGPGLLHLKTRAILTPTTVRRFAAKSTVISTRKVPRPRPSSPGSWQRPLMCEIISQSARIRRSKPLRCRPLHRGIGTDAPEDGEPKKRLNNWWTILTPASSIAPLNLNSRNITEKHVGLSLSSFEPDRKSVV